MYDGGAEVFAGHLVVDQGWTPHLTLPAMSVFHRSLGLPEPCGRCTA